MPIQAFFVVILFVAIGPFAAMRGPLLVGRELGDVWFAIFLDFRVRGLLAQAQMRDLDVFLKIGPRSQGRLAGLPFAWCRPGT
jgi:hypothetical protein